MSTATPSPTAISLSPAPGARLRISLPHPQQLALAGLLVIEVVVFCLVGTNFATLHNAFEIGRLSTELGLLALALTPVIVTGGIDLSVGSLMGLSAVLFGKMWRDAGLPPSAAAVGAIGFAGLAGGLNALLITRLRIPALIVTLGSYSLFRGLAEGITGGVDNFTSFPARFLFLGNGSLGPIPAQLPICVVAAIGFWLLLHRSVIGRALSAIGYAEEGARHAAIRVKRYVALTYILSGLCAGVAAVIYVARLGQAKADAGTGYELLAITAVVLGGTSIFGGRGSILGTLLGLLTIAVLKNGLQLSDEPQELAGILTGLLLLLAIALDFKPRRIRREHAAQVAVTNAEAFDMRNSQLAVLSIVILASAMIVLVGNYLLVRGLEHASVAPGSPVDAPPRHQLTIAMMPKSLGNAYFIACRRGAEEAANQLGAKLLWDGPTDPDPAKQNEIVETWITRGVDVMAVACENREGISTALRKARQRGIKVITWDSDAEPDARDFFVNQATVEGIGNALMDNAARVLGGKGEFAIITASLTASNMNQWRKQIELRRQSKYPDINMATVQPCDDLQSKAFEQANTIMSAFPQVKLIMAICSPAVPGAAEAVKQAGRSDVKVIGLGLPNDNKKYVHEGITDAVILWNTMDLGYLTVRAADDLHKGKIKPGDAFMDGGRLGKIEIQSGIIVLGKPMAFAKDNIDQFDF